MRRHLAETFRSLTIRNYRLFAAGQLISLIGMWMQIVAVDWLVLQLSGDSGTALGLVTALQFTPLLVLSLYGGKLADSFDKRKLLLWANTLWCAMAATLAAMTIAGTVQLWHVYVFAFSLGVVNAVENPVRQSFVSEMVGNESLPNALSLSSATFNSARIVGPALAGGLIALFGTGVVIAINAATYAAPVVGLLLMDVAVLHRAAGKPAAARIRDGLKYTTRRPDLMLPLVLMFVVAGVGFNFPVTLALMAKVVFATGPATFGVLTAASAVGALAGALFSAKRRDRPSAHVLLGAAAAFGALEIVVAFAPSLWTAALLLLPTGFAMVYVAQAANQRVQLGVVPAFRGRIMSIYVLVFLGSAPLFAPAIGWISEVVNPRAGLWIGGAASLAAAAVGFAIRCRRRDVHVVFKLRPVPRLRLSQPLEKVA
ncbi:MAG: MFS transporter [Stackebrandtia sp.]